MPSLSFQGGPNYLHQHQHYPTQAGVAVVGSVALLVTALLLCAKKKTSLRRSSSFKKEKSSSADLTKRVALLELQLTALEVENVALRQNANTALQSEVVELKRTTAMLMKAAPRPPASAKHFLSEKFRPAWAMLLNVFPQSVALELEEYAEALSSCTTAFREGVVDFVFDESNWFVSVCLSSSSPSTPLPSPPCTLSSAHSVKTVNLLPAYLLWINFT